MKQYVQTIEEVLQELSVQANLGLSQQKVQASRGQYGENKLVEKVGESIVHMIIGELTGFLNILLMLAALVSILASHHFVDS